VCCFFLHRPGPECARFVLGYVLAVALTSGQVVAVVIASRVILVFADLLMAGLVSLMSPRRSKAVV